MTYARSRLWLGISGVGLIVVITAISLWFKLPARLLAGFSDAAAISLTLLVYLVISIPGDVLGGYLLPRRHRRAQLNRAVFFAAWLRGVVAQALTLGVSAMAQLAAGRWGGRVAEVGCFTMIMLILLAVQPILARLTGGFAIPSGTVAAQAELDLRSTVFGSSDPGFVGGLVGFPGAERLILPGHWQQELAPDLLAAEFIRRRGAIATGARTRGLAVALAWNVLGFSLACSMPGASPGNAPGLIQTALWFTLWSFAGLLLLPSVNRPAVLEVDRFALEQGVSRTVLAETIAHLDRLQDDEPTRTRWVERIFHPIPSVDQRVAALAQAQTGRESTPAQIHPRRGAWQCARTALYLSWACFGFLSRAVHCNAGRPELWVLFPGD